VQQSTIGTQEVQRMHPPTNCKMWKQCRWYNSQHQNWGNTQDT